MSDQSQDAGIESEIFTAKLRQPPAVQQPTAQATGLFQRVAHSRLAVLAVLFLMTGFLGIPLLWMNPRFSTAERWFWAVVVSIYTCALIGLAGWVVWWSWTQIQSSF